VKSDGSVGGYSGSDPKNIEKKVELLRKDGIEVKNGKIDLKKHLHRF
jgi:alkylated DNA nucleotide flippase Atl1